MKCPVSGDKIPHRAKPSTCLPTNTVEKRGLSKVYFLVCYSDGEFYTNELLMKTKTKKSVPPRKPGSPKRNSRSPRKSIENRDLNEDRQEQITNVERDDDLALPSQYSYSQNAEFEVEEEEDREQRRKAESVHPDEPMK